MRVIKSGKTVFLHDKAKIEAFLRRNTPLNIYALGDLDDFFWDNTAWPGLMSSRRLKYLALVYHGVAGPTLLALCDENSRPWAAELLKSLAGSLPAAFYSHLSPGLAGVLERTHRLDSRGTHYKMTLTDKRRVMAADVYGVKALSKKDLPALLKCYRRAYPDNWFDPRMLETGMYFGIKEGGEIVAVAGVHVYSKKYRVAALGNITTVPEMRGRGLSSRVTTRVCRELLKSADFIGLNVKAANEAAVSCYRRLGFTITAPYEEYSVSVIKTLDNL